MHYIETLDFRTGEATNNLQLLASLSKRVGHILLISNYPDLMADNEMDEHTSHCCLTQHHKVQGFVIIMVVHVIVSLLSLLSY